MGIRARLEPMSEKQAKPSIWNRPHAEPMRGEWPQALLGLMMVAVGLVFTLVIVAAAGVIMVLGAMVRWGWRMARDPMDGGG